MKLRKAVVVGLVAGLLLMGAAPTSSASKATFKAQFCPECWEYLEGPGSVDMKGNCQACGKYPVEIEASRMSWWWCGLEKKWRRAPCPENWMKRCCTEEESLALVSTPGPDVTDAWYCPAHRQFYVIRIPILMQAVCRICARPAVRAQSKEMAWYWCEYDGVWSAAPCPMAPARKCCVKRDGTLLVKIDPGPIAK
ncbi:MAG TPA: hypothetical protein VEN81_04270 [Planctomycetota bacterium]|nr:hypothetical protein [Planctomycetota bacterium]